MDAVNNSIAAHFLEKIGYRECICYFLQRASERMQIRQTGSTGKGRSDLSLLLKEAYSCSGVVLIEY